jgi:hypothetical protein
MDVECLDPSAAQVGLFLLELRKCHIDVLRRFCDLYRSVESLALSVDDKPRRVQQFLVCAEARYIRYLNLLDEIASQIPDELEICFKDVMPLPPW